MASWHDDQRMCLETFHGQSSLLDDPPVLIRATKTAGGANGRSAAPFPLTADPPPAAQSAVPVSTADPEGSAMTHASSSGRAGAAVPTNDNAVREQSLSRTRSLTARRSIA